MYAEDVHANMSYTRFAVSLAWKQSQKGQA